MANVRVRAKVVSFETDILIDAESEEEAQRVLDEDLQDLLGDDLISRCEFEILSGESEYDPSEEDEETSD